MIKLFNTMDESTTKKCIYNDTTECEFVEFVLLENDIKAVIIMPDGTNQYAKINELSFIDDLSIIYC